MRTVRGLTGLAFVAAFAAACSTGGGASPSAAAVCGPDRGRRASRRPSAAPSRGRPPSADAVRAGRDLALKTAGTLTIGADNPAYPPYFEPSDTNPDPWELGDPTNGKGFESAVGVHDRRGDGLHQGHGHLDRRRRSTTRSRPVPRTSTSTSPRSRTAPSEPRRSTCQRRLLRRRPSRSSCRQGASSPRRRRSPTSRTSSSAPRSGRPASRRSPTSSPRPRSRRSTTPTTSPVAALKNGQIDGLVVDLPTAFYVAGVQLGDGDHRRPVRGLRGAASTSASPGQGQPAHRVRERGDRPAGRDSGARRARHAVAARPGERPRLPALTHGPGRGPGGGRGRSRPAARGGPASGWAPRALARWPSRSSRPSSSSGVIGYVVVNSPGWPRFQESFLNGPIFWESLPKLIAKFWVNVRLFLIAEVLILVFGLVLAVLRSLSGPVFFPLRLMATVYVDVFRAIPGLLIIFLLGLGIPALRIPGVPNDEFFWAVIALTLVYSAYVSEVYRAGHRLDPPEPGRRPRGRSACRAGRPSASSSLPQAVRRVIPPLLNDFIGLQKDTVLVSFIGVVEVFRETQILQAATFNFTPYVATALIFLVVTIPLARFTDWLIAREQAARRQRGRGDERRHGPARDRPRRRDARRRDRDVALSIEGLHKSFGELEVLRGHRPRGRRARGRRAHRGVGERQVHAPALHQPDRADRRRPDPDRGRRDHRQGRRRSTASGAGSGSCSRPTTCSRTCGCSTT